MLCSPREGPKVSPALTCAEPNFHEIAKQVLDYQYISPLPIPSILVLFYLI